MALWEAHSLVPQFTLIPTFLLLPRLIGSLGQGLSRAFSNWGVNFGQEWGKGTGGEVFVVSYVGVD
jgi:hypothetical protein